MAEPLLRALRRLRTLLTAIERWVGGASLLLLLLLALAQILARNLFDIGLPTADTLTRHLVLYVTFFGATLAVHERRHIKIDVLCACLHQRWIERLHRPIHLLGALVCGLLTQAAIEYWREEWQYATDYDRWTVLLSLILPAGFGLLTLHFLLSAALGYHEREWRR